MTFAALGTYWWFDMFGGWYDDAALQKLPVVIGVDRAGLNASDGATHHGIFDVSFLSGIPGDSVREDITYRCSAI